jgi:hypothetical protein
MEAQSSAFRLRALRCELRAHDTPDPLIKAEWDEIAIEWHLLASAAWEFDGFRNRRSR